MQIRFQKEWWLLAVILLPLVSNQVCDATTAADCNACDPGNNYFVNQTCFGCVNATSKYCSLCPNYLLLNNTCRQCSSLTNSSLCIRCSNYFFDSENTVCSSCDSAFTEASCQLCGNYSFSVNMQICIYCYNITNQDTCSNCGGFYFNSNLSICDFCTKARTKD